VWEKEYKTRRFYWGLRPVIGLKEVLKYTKKGIALDIGAGEGRNSIFLAKNGFEVEAMDKIKAGLEKCKKLAKKYNLPIKTKVIDIKNFDFKKNRYTLILGIGVFDFLRFSEFKKIIKKIYRSLTKNGIFYLIVFSIRDPAFKRYKEKNLATKEKNTFYLPKIKMYRHFFSKKELLNLLGNFQVIKIREEKIKDVHDFPHYHSLIRVIARKK